jgi:hypothetical protein
MQCCICYVLSIYLCVVTFFSALVFPGPTKAVSKEIERIDQFFYTYADRSSGIIEYVLSDDSE